MVERTGATAGDVRAAVQPSTDPLVSIVIVTYGTGEVVLDALASIVEHTTLPYEVIVVDNPAPGRPATRDLLRRATSGVVLVTPDDNLGFGGGNDAGVEHARGELVSFVNPDLIVTAGWLEPLVEALGDPAVAIAAPPLLDLDGTIGEAGQVVYDDGCTAAVGGPEVLTGDEGQLFDRDVDYASAACWLLRRSEHIARDGFDRRFWPAFFEDADYGLRVEREGQVTRLVTARPVYHHRGSGGAGRDLELGARALEVFRSVHADELASRLPRPLDERDALALRDRPTTRPGAPAGDKQPASGAPGTQGASGERGTQGGRTVRVVTADCADDAIADAFEQAVADAAAAPRERVTLATGRRGPLSDADLARGRSAGLEIVIGDVDRAVAVRRAPNVPVVVTRTECRTGRGAPMGVSAAVAVAAIAVLGIVFRWIVLRSSAGRFNADEAYTGIESFEILAGRFPVVLGGTAYTAVFESYIFTPYMAVFGAHMLPLKLIATIFWAIAALVVAAIARDLVLGTHTADPRTSARRAAVVAGGLVWVAPGALLTLSTNAYESYASGMAVTVTAYWLARRIVDHAAPGWKPCVLLGVAAGLGFWMHPMFLSTLVPMLVVVLVRHRRRLGVWVSVVVGGLIGCGPFLAWNVANRWPSLTSPVESDSTYAGRLTTFLSDLVPRAFGLRDGALDWMLGGLLGPLLYVLLIVATAAGTMLAFRSDARPSRFLLPAVLVVVFPAMALFPPLVFANDGRYGIVSFPFIAVAVAVAVVRLAEVMPRTGAAAGPAAATRRRRAVVPVATFAVVAAVWLGAFLGPHLRLLLDETDGDPNASTVEVVERIRAAGLEHVYGSYWRVLPVEFVANREITGGVLAPFPVRFPERQAEVEAVGEVAPERVAFVFQLDDDDPSRLWLAPDAYDRHVVGDTVLYLPVAGPG